MKLRMFPVAGGTDIKEVPWVFMELFEQRVKKDYHLDLEQLAKRGGLGADELVCVIAGERLELFDGTPNATWKSRLNLAVSEWWNQSYPGHLLEVLYELRCILTGNPVGTDTRPQGDPCRCGACSAGLPAIDFLRERGVIQ